MGTSLSGRTVSSSHSQCMISVFIEADLGRSGQMGSWSLVCHGLAD